MPMFKTGLQLHYSKMSTFRHDDYAFHKKKMEKTQQNLMGHNPIMS